MNILLTNDDGYQAKGLHKAASILSELGTVTVVAPEKQQSAVSQRITLHKPLRLKQHDLSKSYDCYSFSGSPADCVKIGVHRLCQDKKTNLLVSGINHSGNSGYNIFYSGTVAGAMEGMLQQIPSIAISLDSTTSTDFRLAQIALKKIAMETIKHGLPEHIFLNVNIPPISPEECRGISFCDVSTNKFFEEFHKRTDPNYGTYYWLGGKKYNVDPNPLSDDNVLGQKRVAVSPVSLDINQKKPKYSFNHWKLSLSS